MNPKISIIVYGLKEGITGGSGGCNCSGDCGPTRSMGESYKDLARFLKKSDVKSYVDLHFVDLMEDELGGTYNEINNLLNRGYKLPFVMINGRITFFGGIPKEEIYYNIRRYLG